jgi:hypothetical protein
LAAGLAPVVAVADPADPLVWSADLSVATADSNTSVRDGQLRLGTEPARPASAGGGELIGIRQFPVHLTGELVSSVSATVDATALGGASVAVDVRGLLPGGRWTEWIPAPAVLPQPSEEVQTRLVLTAPPGAPSPAVRGVRFRASTVGTHAAPRLPALSSRVFATREGLVGRTTANGHVITSRDHFVALPSRRGLSSNGSTEYSVLVCVANSRCEIAPVWDVGPWNTRDDYWNPTPNRQMWRDLPRGMPQAQAAYRNGYNGGRDGYGRRVANPAGIDLADGTFWDGLRLRGNSWVLVYYMWTTVAPANGKVITPARAVPMSTGPSTAAATGMAADTATVPVHCQVRGERVRGSQGSSPVWYRVAARKYLAAANIAGVDPHAVPPC